MPTYSAMCPKCGEERDFVSTIAKRDETPNCEHDGQKMIRVLTAAMVPAMGIADHYQIVSGTGKTYYGRDAYLKDLASKGLRPASDLAGEAEHQKKQNDAKAKAERKAQVAALVQKHTA